jgi:hypothetical protein
MLVANDLADADDAEPDGRFFWRHELQPRLIFEW